MGRSTVLFLTLPALWLTSCGGETQVITERYPDLHLSVSGTDIVDFGSSTFDEVKRRVVLVENLGDLPMGIKSIFLQEKGMPDNFSLEFDADDISCDSKSTATAKDVGVDTGDTASGGDTSSSDTAADTAADTGVDIEELKEDYIVLDGGCRLPVTVSFRPIAQGDVFAAMEVESVTEPLVDEDGRPTYFADPRNFKEVTIFRGEGLRGTGDIFVSPRLLNFGDVWNQDEEFRYIFLENRGDGDLLLGEPRLSEDCSAEFSLDLELFTKDGVLPPADTTLFQIKYAPFSTAPAECSIFIESSDPVEGEIEITVRGNLGADPANQPPTVEIVHPLSGSTHDSSNPIEFQIRMTDPNQPATSLSCTLSATAQVGGVLASCDPESDNGFVRLEIDTELLEEGPEAYVVQVTDLSGLSAAHSISMNWNSIIPTSDDDGDGFGDDPEDAENGLFDCDDADASIFPGAAELANSLDDDCDGAIDEDTIFSDDDGDSVSEAAGDCDDGSRDTYPGAPELPDGEDNDCDGIVDEGTRLFDDDQDGFNEENGDCNDRNPTINPGQPELCDAAEVDENCNGYINRVDPDGCISSSSDPLVIGGCILEDRALNAGESTTATMFVYDADTPAEGLRYDWGLSPENIATVASPASGFTSITFPVDVDVLEGRSSKDFLVFALVYDGEVSESPGQDWCADEISVFSADNPLVETRDQIRDDEGDLTESTEATSSGCGGEAALVLGPLFGLLALSRRRREER